MFATKQLPVFTAFVFLATAVAEDLAPAVVQTSKGQILGRVEKPIFNTDKHVYVFQGIPFAVPPVGELRWKKPVEPDNFPSPLNATSYGSMCAQLFDYRAFSDEDCLQLNVFTPTVNASAKLPVGVWIHGGGFQTGSAVETSELGLIDNFAAREIVLVTLNYRLGPFGFFTTFDDKAPANLGLWDLAMGLRWVQKEIGQFGGDPNQVTIFGQSAGGAVCDALQLSPMAAGLFQKMITMSGTTAELIPPTNSEELNSSVILTQSLGCIKSKDEWIPKNFETIMACMRAKNQSEILDAAQGILVEVPWLPAIDGSGGFLPEPLETLRSKRSAIPTMIGMTRDEMSIALILSVLLDDCELQTYNPDKLMNLTKRIYNGFFHADFDKDLPQPLARTVVRLGYISPYKKSPKNHRFWIEQANNVNNDIQYGRTIYITASSIAMTGAPVYLYEFDYISDNFMTDPRLPFRAIAHAYDTFVMFGGIGVQPPGLPAEFAYNGTADDWNMYDMLGRLVTNFIKVGNPTPESEKSIVPWKPTLYNKTTGEYNTNYYSIKTIPEMQPRFRPVGVDVWANIIPKLSKN